MTTHACVIVFIEFQPLWATGTAQSVDKAIAWLERICMSVSEAEKYEFTFHQFDNKVVWLLPLDSPANLRHASGHPFHALLRIVQTQDEILALGAMCHGVVTIGQAGYTNRGPSGPGIGKSQSLLSFWRSYPRIVVDPMLLRLARTEPLLRAEHHAAADELGYIRRLLYLDSDGAWFVDYLRAVESEVDTPEDYGLVLLKHQRIIDEELATVGDHGHAIKDDGSGRHGDDQVRALLWLATYHNRTVRDIDPGLLVRAVPWLFEFP